MRKQAKGKVMPKPRNPVAAALRNPEFRGRFVPNKKRVNQRAKKNRAINAWLGDP